MFAFPNNCALILQFSHAFTCGLMLMVGLNMVNRAFHHTCKNFCRQNDS